MKRVDKASEKQLLPLQMLGDLAALSPEAGHQRSSLSNHRFLKSLKIKTDA